MNSPKVWRLRAENPQHLGRYARGEHRLSSKAEAERMRAGLIARNPDAVITIQVANAWTPQGHLDLNNLRWEDDLT